MSYFVFRDNVDPNKPHTKILNDGTVIKGGYEVAYKQDQEGLTWAKQCARRVRGHVYIKSKRNMVKVWSAPALKNKKQNNNKRRAA